MKIQLDIENKVVNYNGCGDLGEIKHIVSLLLPNQQFHFKIHEGIDTEAWRDRGVIYIHNYQPYMETTPFYYTQKSGVHFRGLDGKPIVRTHLADYFNLQINTNTKDY